MPKLLKFVDKSDPILREVIEEIKNFKDPALQKTIKNMRYSILPEQLKKANGAHENAAGMAANQWGIRKRVFIFAPGGTSAKDTLEVMINPSYVPHLRENESEFKMVSAYEGCFSIPLTTAVVNRYDAIIATYYDLHGKKIERHLEGFAARVFQHETDHLNGKLFDGKLDNYAGPDCFDRVIFKDKEEMENFWISIVRPSRD